MLFDLIKTVITKGTYDKDNMTKKMDVLLLNSRISDEEYSELVTLMG